MLLIEKTEWEIHKWAKEDRLKLLNTQPFHSIISIEGEKIIVNMEKVRSLCPSDMYSWFYDVVDLCRSECKITSSN